MRTVPEFPTLSPWAPQLTAAAVSSPRSVTLSSTVRPGRGEPFEALRIAARNEPPPATHRRAHRTSLSLGNLKRCKARLPENETLYSASQAQASKIEAA